MKITPIEIKQKSFSQKSFGKGFDRDEVQSFLKLIADEWGILLDDNRKMQIKIELLEKEIDKLKEVENSLFRTLKTAEDTSTNIVDQARKTAELKTREAQLKAEVILNDARGQAKEIVRKSQERARQVLEEAVMDIKNKEREYRDLEGHRANFLIEFKSFIQETLEKTQRFESVTTAHKSLEEKTQKVQELLEDQSELVDQQEVILEQEQIAEANANDASDLENSSLEADAPSSQAMEEDKGNSFFDEVEK